MLVNAALKVMKSIAKMNMLMLNRYSGWAALLMAFLIQIVASSVPAIAKEIENNQNCGAQKIRRDGVRLATHGVDLYLYPDAPIIDEHYSGCQNIWLEDEHPPEFRLPEVT